LEDWAKHRYFKNRVTNKIKVDKDSYSKCLIEQNSGYPNLFWKTVKKILPGERKEMPSRIWIDENISSDMNTIANAFNIFFADTAHQHLNYFKETLSVACTAILLDVTKISFLFVTSFVVLKSHCQPQCICLHLTFGSDK
jgi:hypothetical protein